MRIIDVPQGSPEWLQARIGLPTASNFDRIVTPRTAKPSASAEKYLAHVLSEWFLGESLEEGESGFMERGRELEPEARASYEFDSDLTTRQVGLCTTDDGKVGASPDSLVGDDGVLEIKCPAIHTHMAYLIGAESVAAEYRCQIQGQLWVCERDWADILSYHPILPPVRIRVERDEEFIQALIGHVADFVHALDRAKEGLAERRAKYQAKRESELAAMDTRDPDPFGTTTTDIDPADLMPVRRS